MAKDNFLNYTSAEMATCTESVIAADLGMPFDYDGKLAENIVRENYSSFLHVYNTDFNGIEILDKTTNDDHAIVGFVKDKEYVIVSYKFVLTSKNFDFSKKQKWELINKACALYLDLNPDVSNYKIDK